MIRPLTCVCMLLAGVSGLYLYQSKHRAQMLDREIERTLRAADVARDRISVLRGEWALLNEPERLAALSQSHLGLKSLTPSQFVTAAELGARLPMPVAPGTTFPPEDEEAAPAAAAALPLPPALTSVAAIPLPAHAATMAARTPPVPPAAPPRTPVQVASVLQPLTSPLPPPRPAPSPSLLASVVNVSTSPMPVPQAPRPALARPVPPANTGAGPATPSARSSTQAPPGLSIGESVARMARSQNSGQAAGAAVPAPQPAYNPPANSQPAQREAVASALGGVRPLLPPPVPFGSAMAASAASSR